MFEDSFLSSIPVAWFLFVNLVSQESNDFQRARSFLTRLDECGAFEYNV